MANLACSSNQLSQDEAYARRLQVLIFFVITQHTNLYKIVNVSDRR